MSFIMPGSLTIEEKTYAYEKLFGLKSPSSFLGEPWYLFNRVIICLTGFSSQSLMAKFRGKDLAGENISDLEDKYLHVMLKVFRLNPNWSHKHPLCLKNFLEKKFTIIKNNGELFGETIYMLCRACQVGNKILVEQIMKTDSNLNLNSTPQYMLATPLMAAAMGKKDDVVDLLLSNPNVNINQEVARLDIKEDALSSAARTEDNQAIVLKLLETNQFSRESIFKALKKGMLSFDAFTIGSFLEKMDPLTKEEFKEIFGISLNRSHPRDLIEFWKAHEKTKAFFTRDFLTACREDLENERDKAERHARSLDPFYSSYATGMAQNIADPLSKKIGLLKGILKGITL